MAKFGEALTSAGVYGTPEKNGNDKKDNNNGEKGARKKLRITREHDERPAATTHGFLMGRKELCLEISSVMSECFSDYIGCNFVLYPNGQTSLFALFGAETRNDKAPFRAFNPNTRATSASNIKGAYAIHSAKFSAYTPTQDGIDCLSDLVSAGNNQKDKDGRVKQFKNFWSEEASVATNGMQVYYGMNAPVYAKVVLDIDRVLRMVWPKEDISDQYQYTVNFTNFLKCNDASDQLVRVDEISRNEAQKILEFVGAVPKQALLGTGVEVF